MRRTGFARKNSAGFSTIELMVVLGIALIMVRVAVPAITGVMRTYRRDGAVNHLVGDLRRARNEAIMTGWQYRVFGYSNSSTSAYKNQYRIMGRSSTAAGWPSDTAATFQSSTQLARDWINIPRIYQGVTLVSSDANADFFVAFDSRGARIELDSFAPLSVAGQTVSSRTLTVSAVGSARIQ
jgi:Tfp pilus assembly protein FimT